MPRQRKIRRALLRMGLKKRFKPVKTGGDWRKVTLNVQGGDPFEERLIGSLAMLVPVGLFLLVAFSVWKSIWGM